MDLSLTNIIFLFFTLLGIILSILFYIKGKKEKVPVYDIEIIKIIDESFANIKGLSIYYDKIAVGKLSRILVAFFNQGRELLESKDIPTFDPIRIELINSQVLSEPFLRFIPSPNNKINLAVNQNKNEIIINFDYLAHKEGVVFEFYTDALTEINIVFSGSVKGIMSIIPRSQLNTGTPYTVILIDKVFPKSIDHLPIITRILLYILALLIVPIAFVSILIEFFIYLTVRILFRADVLGEDNFSFYKYR